MPNSSATNAQRVISETVVEVHDNNIPHYTVMQEITGISTDVKPTNVATGSVFFEVDTGDIYMFNAEATEWVKQGATEDEQET